MRGARSSPAHLLGRGTGELRAPRIRAFLDAHTLGWDELEPAVAPCTPAWGEARTGVPAAQIEEAAQIYGAGPALLWLGQGLQRQAMGGNVMRACALLPAVTGNFGKPGAGMLYLNGSGRKGVDGDYLSGAALSQSPPSFSQMELAARLEDPADIQAFLCWNINPAASSPEQARLRSARMRAATCPTACLSAPDTTTWVFFSTWTSIPSGNANSMGWEYPSANETFRPFTCARYPTPTMSSSFLKPSETPVTAFARSARVSPQ